MVSMPHFPSFTNISPQEMVYSLANPQRDFGDSDWGYRYHGNRHWDRYPGHFEVCRQMGILLYLL